MKRILVIALSMVMVSLSVALGQNADAQKLIQKARLEIANLQLTEADQDYKQAIDLIEQELDYSEAESKAAREEWKQLQKVSQYLADGKRSLERQDYQDAAKKYADAIRTMTDSGNPIWNRIIAEANYQWGMVYYWQDNTTDAAAKFRESIKAAPGEENYSKALYNIVVKHYNEGLKYYKRRDYRNAKTEYEQSVLVDPTFSKGYYMLALIAKTDNNADQALDFYQKAIENDPQYDIAWFGLGKLYADLGRMSKAVEAFTQTVNINPKYQKGFFERGQAYLTLKEKNKALSDFKKALEIDPEYSLVYESLGQFYNDDKNFDETIKVLSKIKGTDAATYKTCYSLAQAYNETQSFENALKCANNSLAQKTNWAPAYFEKGRALAGLKRKNEAIDAFKAAAKDGRWKSPAEYEINVLTKWADQ
ncbi:MAG: hypothetical protein CO167_02930 [Candidatus Marinimicrobia bacterium CG_4_9_14_3_um_filter_48_9]|nr:MAG: hypothetical protein CO167_02930 [Candidatus Marinimicrobia bacterium CG_4_9_14_3_um_filter_48_9]